MVHLGTDIPAERAVHHPEPTVATLGHVIPRKRHVDVLRALPPNVHWVVIGDGPELERLRSMADERATFLGQLPHDQAMRELARCHVMALPSEDEAFGVAYVEALARGLPAIGCAGEGGPEEIAALGGGMLLVPPRDPHALYFAIERALADAIAGALSDRARWRDLSAAARRTAAEHFTLERCGRLTVDAYREALR